MVNACVCQTDGVIAAELERYAVMIPADEVSSLKTAERITARYLLRYMLERDFGIDPSNVVLVREQGGKPYLQGMPDVHFSISHSGGRCACSVGNIPHGIDIELLRDRDHSKVIERIFSDAERIYVSETESADERMRRFYEIWTMKESCSKLAGTGISAIFDKLDVITGEGCGKSHFVKFSGDGVIGSVCVPPGQKVNIEFPDLDQ